MSAIAGLALRGRRLPEATRIEALGAALAHRGAPGAAVLAPGAALIGVGGAAIPQQAGAATLIASDLPPEPVALGAAHGLAEAEPARLPLLLYRRSGLGFAAALPGPFALAVQDHAMRRLVLARDAFGIAPLYLAETAEGLAFASEPRAFFAAGLVPPRLRPPARDELLQLQFSTGAETLFEGVARVLPGECLAIADGAVVERRRHAALPEGGPEPLTEAAALERFEAAFLPAVMARLEGATAVLLTGGVNGAALLAALRRLGVTGGEALVPLPEGGAAGVRQAAAIGLPVRPIPIGEAEIWASLPGLAAALDDPTADPGAALLWAVGSAVRGTVPALLCGDGADELLAGQSRHRAAMRPWWLWGRAMRARGAFDRLDVLRAEPRAWRDGIAATEAAVAGGGRTRLQAAQALDVADFLPHDLLLRLDRCLAARGVAPRLPFLDAAVAAACFRLPDALKVREGRGKWLLRRWVAQALPGAAAERVGQGVRLPLGAWIERRAGELGPLVARQAGIAELCRPGRVEALFRHAGDRRAGPAAWHLLFYALWHRAHIEGRPGGADVFEALR
ncbi:MAG: asparagine synthase-related protein [Rubritepida sp.]|jgi:asparagine synthase (glutamine-hydrolysing)|nr:asparagine synthase-related protein [Rubritepida sp.]